MALAVMRQKIVFHNGNTAVATQRSINRAEDGQHVHAGLRVAGKRMIPPRCPLPRCLPFTPGRAFTAGRPPGFQRARVDARPSPFRMLPMQRFSSLKYFLSLSSRSRQAFLSRIACG